MQAVGHAAPVVALDVLHHEHFYEDCHTKQSHADKAQIHTPQYVFLYFHCLLCIKGYSFFSSSIFCGGELSGFSPRGSTALPTSLILLRNINSLFTLRYSHLSS